MGPWWRLYEEEPWVWRDAQPLPPASAVEACGRPQSVAGAPHSYWVPCFQRWLQGPQVHADPREAERPVGLQGHQGHHGPSWEPAGGTWAEGMWWQRRQEGQGEHGAAVPSPPLKETSWEAFPRSEGEVR